MAALLSGTFTGTGSSSEVPLYGQFNISLQGTFTGTVRVERKFPDDSANWHVVSRDAAGTEASYTAPAGVVCIEGERSVTYRLTCTAYTSGPIRYRISQ